MENNRKNVFEIEFIGNLCDIERISHWGTFLTIKKVDI